LYSLISSYVIDETLEFGRAEVRRTDPTLGTVIAEHAEQMGQVVNKLVDDRREAQSRDHTKKNQWEKLPEGLQITILNASVEEGDTKAPDLPNTIYQKFLKCDRKNIQPHMADDLEAISGRAGFGQCSMLINQGMANNAYQAQVLSPDMERAVYLTSFACAPKSTLQGQIVDEMNPTEYNFHIENQSLTPEQIAASCKLTHGAAKTTAEAIDQLGNFVTLLGMGSNRTSMSLPVVSVWA